jgi:hypothetical protein
MIPVNVRRVFLAEYRVDFRKQMTGFTVGGAGCRLTVVQARGASMWGDR